VIGCAEEFLAFQGHLWDVRSPQEYTQGHIPGAINLPLFSDRERVSVGTCYKRESKRAAIQMGLDFVCSKIDGFIDQFSGDSARFYCFRGGMRSQSMMHLATSSGTPATCLKGGYKAFRRLTRDLFARKWKLKILGGFTGVGKTKTLRVLKERGEQVLDLERLACHLGSAFGNLRRKTQPTSEHFENKVAMELLKFDEAKPVWVEDESRSIGACSIPGPFFETMRASPVFVIKKSLDERVDYLLELYGDAPKGALIDAVQRIEKRLGSERARAAILSIEDGDLKSAIKYCLAYYDKTYAYGLSLRSQFASKFCD